MNELEQFEEDAAKYGLRDRIKKFVLSVWGFCDQLPNSPSGKNVAGQLTRASSSVGANFRAAFRGRSANEYLAKLGIAEEEADECCYWLDLTASRGKWIDLKAQAESLGNEADQITAIIVSLIKKGKKRIGK